jgi:hypothetical protein
MSEPQEAVSPPPPPALYLVATPIGNLADITIRSLDLLKSVDRIACEDTRHSGRLLAHHGIKSRLVSLNEHNEAKRIPEFIEAIDGGGSIALISDAGTPTISDPGQRLVQAAVEAGIPGKDWSKRPSRRVFVSSRFRARLRRSRLSAPPVWPRPRSILAGSCPTRKEPAPRKSPAPCSVIARRCILNPRTD